MRDETRQRDRADIVLELFEAYHDRVYAFARKSAEPAVAEDATQEAFVRLLQHPRLEELEISISYILKIVHNILRRRFTRSVRLREIVDENIKPRIRQREEDSSPKPLETTAAVLQDGWLHTGDLGRLDAEGNLTLTGRSKDVIILENGKNVHPEDVEAQYERSPYIAELCVVGRGDRLHAVIVPEWEKLTQPQSAAFVSMPSLIDPALAPEGCHVIHAYLPATEPYEVWEGVARGTADLPGVESEEGTLEIDPEQLEAWMEKSGLAPPR